MRLKFHNRLMKMVSLIIVLTFMLVPVNLLHAAPSGAGSLTNNSNMQYSQTNSGVSDFVTRLYQLCLSREPDPTGLSYWVNTLQTGQNTGADVAYRFLFSNEFQNRAVGDKDFVTILYNTFLGRGPDIGGLNYWLSELYNGMSRYAVLAGFANSAEFGNLCKIYSITQGSITPSSPADINQSTTAFMTRLYRLCLNRLPDPIGLNNWVNDLQTGKNTVQGVVYAFIFSNEFQNRNLSNADFITIMYRVLLDREPDAGGFADWLNIINSGVSRYQIFLGFSNSDEFHNRWKTFDTNYGYIDIIPVSAITVTGTGDATTITTDNGTLQMLASVLPANATDKTVTWSIADGTGTATISAGGLLTALTNGTVTVTATASDGSLVTGTKEIIISNQATAVTSIVVAGTADATTIITDLGTLQMSAAVLPANATDKTVTWSVANGTGSATISFGGLLTALTNGTVTVTATANDGSLVTGTKEITISNQTTAVTSIVVMGTADATTIITDNGTLQMSAAVLPANATDKTVTWSVADGTGSATISAGGLLTALTNGTVTVTATANDGSLVTGTKEIIISNQAIAVTSIVVAGTADATTIITDLGKLQMSAAVLPANATDKTVTWSVANGTGSATISFGGLLTALTNGTVTVTATANDGSLMTGTKEITISNQVAVTLNKNITSMFVGLTETLTATVLPLDVADKTIVWSVSSSANPSPVTVNNGLITGANLGIATVTATAADGRKAQCFVTVTDGTNVLTNFNLGRSDTYMPGLIIQFGDALGMNMPDYYQMTTGEKYQIQQTMIYAPEFTALTDIRDTFNQAVESTKLNEINNATVDTMGAALNNYATQWGLDLTSYNELTLQQQGIVHEYLVLTIYNSGWFLTKADLQVSLVFIVTNASAAEIAFADINAATVDTMNSVLVSNASVLGLNLDSYILYGDQIYINTLLVNQVFTNSFDIQTAIDTVIFANLNNISYADMSNIATAITDNATALGLNLTTYNSLSSEEQVIVHGYLLSRPYFISGYTSIAELQTTFNEAAANAPAAKIALDEINAATIDTIEAALRSNQVLLGLSLASYDPPSMNEFLVGQGFTNTLDLQIALGW